MMASNSASVVQGAPADTDSEWAPRGMRALSWDAPFIAGHGIRRWPSNAHAQRPEGERREPPVRWSVMLGRPPSFNNPIRAQEHRWWDRNPERFGCLGIDDELILGSLLHW